MKLILTDFNNRPTKRFIGSLEKSKVSYKNLVIHYDGFLPEGAVNPFAYYIGAEEQPEKHLYFNQIKVPKYYEIRNENGRRATIAQGDNLIGYVYYADGGERIVKEVHWLNKSNKITLVERYNQQGNKYADVIYNKDEKESKVLYYKNNQVIIEHDIQSGSINHFVEGKLESFPTLIKFIINYIKTVVFKEHDIDEAVFNGLGTSYFVSHDLDIPSSLYFQELIKDEIPGNMQGILKGNRSVKRVIFESNKQLTKAMNIIAKTELTHNPSVEMVYLGAIEEFTRENKLRKKFLTLTRSDNILHAEAFVQRFPDVEWTIAAPTDVSDKLRNFANKYENVHLIKQMLLSDIDSLLESHDYYLDFNSGQEVSNIVERAYFEGLLVLGDQKVLKNGNYEIVLVTEEEILDWLARPNQEAVFNVLRTKKGTPATIEDYQEMFK